MDESSSGATRAQTVRATSATMLARASNSQDSLHARDAEPTNYVPSAPALVGQVVGGNETDAAHLRLQRMAAFESHDYDPIDNDLEEDALRARDREDYRREIWWKWATSAMIGMVMGFIAFVVDGLVDKLNLFRYGVIGDKVGTDGYARFVAWLLHVIVSCLFASVAGGLVSYVEPLAAGSGIPELKTYLNGVHLKGLLRLKTAVAKLGGIAFSIGAGLIAGKEGPFVHGGGLVGGGLSAFGSNTLGFRLKKPAWFRDDRNKRDFVAIGTATGVAVAFAAPIGGMLFTVEEGASFYNSDMLWRGFLATCTGVLTMHWLEQLDFDANDFARARFGTHRDFGLYTDNEADYSRNYWWYFWEVPIFILIGACGGLLGAAFVKMNVRITKWRALHIPVTDKRKRLLEVITIAGITSTLFFFFMSVSPCKDVPTPLMPGSIDDLGVISNTTFEYGEETRDEIRKDFFKQLYCPDGQYSVYGQLFYNPLSTSFKFLLHLGEVGEFGVDGEHPFPISALIWYFLLTFSLMTITYGIGAPTGLFVPSLAVGASFGQLVGRIVASIASHRGSEVRINLHAYAIIGAAANLGGATRMTISITVLVMETTGSMQLIIPLMLTIFTAKAVGDKYTHGIYDTHIKIRGAPFLEEPELAGPAADKLRVNEAMADDLVTLQPVMPISDLLQVLTTTSHGAYPVTEQPPAYAGEEFELHGSITRNLLLKMLLHRISFVPTVGGRSDDGRLFSTQRERDELLEQLKQIPFKVPSAREVAHRVSDEDIQTMSVDLRSFMQRHPFVVHGDARLSRAYRQFRTMGLRHMYVMPSRPRVVGLLTRKDIIDERSSLTLGLYARGLAHPRARTVSRSFEPEFDPRDASARDVDGADDAKDERQTHLPYIPYYSNNANTGDDDGVEPSRVDASANPFEASSARRRPHGGARPRP
ncbi:Chloride channel, voltage gated [Ostreococcus tauri]|uniref:Chloride channel protein n=1 Tax=Ostreococcus tauri TaxID=70448 RepID=A0A090M902_OSTTA|nr:Chloride channel, voltage gated [Ostreococcus tauri]CEF99187.1 Chloride channel, voltage gated [Ostreococcus tauri]|eukprot:XP_003081369.2 Chloride channel, voltage gated [Ostreococcus tauri]